MKTLIICLSLHILFLTECKKDSTDNSTNNGSSEDIWDIDRDGIPRFVDVNYIELAKIHEVSRYRSSIGHDYSDAFEHCRSMKHYFEPKADSNWASVRVYSPVSGKITRSEEEWAGTKLEIQSDKYPAFRFIIFHILTSHAFAINEKVLAGEQLGTHIGFQTMSDIAVMVNDPTKQGRLVSYFQVITDKVLDEFKLRGAQNVDLFIISKQQRDANPLDCNSIFGANDTIRPQWVVLN